MLFVCATLLAWNSSPESNKFFKLAIYLGVWNILWSAAQLVVDRTLKAERAKPKSTYVMGMYLVAILLCIVFTAAFASIVFQGL